MENVFENNFKKALAVEELLEKIEDLYTSFASKKDKYTFWFRILTFFIFVYLLMNQLTN